MFSNYTACNAECEENAIAIPDPCRKFEIEFSQIQGVVIVPDAGALPSDWTTQIGWQGVIINDDDSGQYGKYIPLRGSISVPEKVTVQLPRGREKIIKRLYEITGEVDYLSEELRTFFQSLQCRQYRSPKYRFWYETAEGWLYGGATGIKPEKHNANMPLGSLSNDQQLGELLIGFCVNKDAARTKLTVPIGQLSSPYWLYPNATNWEYPDGLFWEYP